LSEQEGGRKVPPSGPIYASTAEFVDDPLEEQFSVLLQFAGSISGDAKENRDVKLSLLFPENLPQVKERLVTGARLFIHEGAKVVAEATILGVETPAIASPRSRRV
jgi:hypothetical protein